MRAFEAQMKELEEVEGSEVKLMRTLKAEFRVVSTIEACSVCYLCVIYVPRRCEAQGFVALFMSHYIVAFV